jgi:hypothetical protein
MLQKALLMLLVLCAWLPAQVITTRCNESEFADNAKPTVALAYLSRDRATLSSACLIKAIRNVEENSYRPAIPVLTKYLDFRMPPPFAPYDPLTRAPTGGLYPAADALARFGEAAVPALNAAIDKETLSLIARSNAANALFVVTKDKARVISLIAKVAQSSADPQTANAFKKLSNDMVSQCKSDELQRCKEALNPE